MLIRLEKKPCCFPDFHYLFSFFQLGAYYYARSKKEAARDKHRRAEIGKAKIGGTFELVSFIV
jgi:hypothetical protein